MENYIIVSFNSAGYLFAYKVDEAKQTMNVYINLEDAKQALAAEKAADPAFCADFVVAKVTPV